MSKYWSDVVRGLTPYVPGEQPKINNLIKLNTNENPYPPSPKALDAIRLAAGADMRLYPDPNADGLKQSIASYYAVSPQQVFVGNSSDEVLAHTFLALLKQDQPLLFPDITYSFYPVFCKLYGIAYENMPLTEHFQINVDDYARPNGGIIFPNPNAPTGCLLALSAIERLATMNQDSVIVVDEAYIDFGGTTAISLIDRFPNILVIQTLSKSRSLAGLRVGFAVGHPELIEALERVKNSFNSYPLDRLAMAGAIAAMDDREYFEHTRNVIIDTREALTQELAALGFEVLPSAANFVFMRHPQHDAAHMSAWLRTQKIIVRHFKQARIDQFLRVSIGTDEECQALVASVRTYLSQTATA